MIEQSGAPQTTAGPFTASGDITSSAGNFVASTAGKGLDVTAGEVASPPGTGAASTATVLANYDEGTWTPIDSSGALLTFSGTSGNCLYTRIGRLVVCSYMITWPATADATAAAVGQLPFTAKNTTNDLFGQSQSFTDVGVALFTLVQHNTKVFNIKNGAATGQTNANLSGKTIRGTITYMI